MAQKKPEIALTPCDSSAIKAFGYDEASKTLAVQFKNGGTHRYADVPPSVHVGLSGAKSVGTFFAKNVRGKFEKAP